MARKLREKGWDNDQHVVSKISRGAMFLNSILIKQLFLIILKESKNKFKYRLKHFCIMDNHIHLLLRPVGNTDISRLMQWVKSNFAIRYNKEVEGFGPVWNGRFKNKIIYDRNQFFDTFDYISNNPVLAGIVSKPEDYEYSGISWSKYNKFRLIDCQEFHL